MSIAILTSPGKGSEHNFASVVPLSDRSLNPLHKAEVDGLIALLLYIQDRKLDILRNVDLGKMVIMCNNVYVIGAITNNVRRWRESRWRFPWVPIKAANQLA